MHYTTLITTDQLADLIGNPLAVIIDCRFALADTSQGYRAYHSGHIPGALYANLDEDLSAKPVAGRSGRHPLPDPAVLAHTLSNWGVAADIQLIAYDDTTGPMASRLWTERLTGSCVTVHAPPPSSKYDVTRPSPL